MGARFAVGADQGVAVGMPGEAERKIIIEPTGLGASARQGFAGQLRPCQSALPCALLRDCRAAVKKLDASPSSSISPISRLIRDLA